MVLIDRAVDRLQIQPLHPLVCEGPSRVNCPLGTARPECMVGKPHVPLALHERVAFEVPAPQHLGEVGLLEMMTAPLGPIVYDPIAESYARIEILLKLRATVQRLGISEQEAHLVTFEC